MKIHFSARLWSWYLSVTVLSLSLGLMALTFIFQNIERETWLKRVNHYELYQNMLVSWEETKKEAFSFSVDGNSLVMPMEYWLRLEDKNAYDARVHAMLDGIQKRSLWKKIGFFLGGIDLDEPWTFHPEMWIAYARDKGLTHEAVKSQLVWDFEAQTWRLTEEKDRKFLQEKEVTLAMRHAFFKGQKEAKLHTELQAVSPTREEMQKALASWENVKTQHLVLEGEGQTFEFSPDQWARGLSFYEKDWHFEPLFLADEAWQNFLVQSEQKAQDVRIEEKNGKISFSGRPQEGKRVDMESLKKAIMQGKIEGKFQEKYSVPMKVEDPKVELPESLKKRGIQDYLGMGYSNFAGSPANRVHNIYVGMNIFNGFIVPKDAVFSFTANMGPIDAAHGWKPELVIVGDETKPEYGGGLCQVSSTLFRAALYTGFPIVERHEHSYAVSYYARPNGWGLDASVYDPSPDFKFKNDTKGDLLVQSVIEGANAYFIFYGTKDGRRVEMEGPVVYGHYRKTEPVTSKTSLLAPGERKLDQAEHVGFKADWWRTIFYADGTKSERENFHSNYEARPAKYLEGEVLPETPSLDPAQI